MQAVGVDARGHQLGRLGHHGAGHRVAVLAGAVTVGLTAEIFFEGLYNKRKTYYDSYNQFYYLTGYTGNFGGFTGDPFSPGWEGLFFLSPTAISGSRLKNGPR